MINNRGSITIIGVMILNISLFLIIITNSFYIESYYLKKEVENSLFYHENIIVKLIYDNKDNYKSNNVEIFFISKKIKNKMVIEYQIQLKYQNNDYFYEVEYNEKSNQISKFNSVYETE